MRISDWSSDVCSSDLLENRRCAKGDGQFVLRAKEALAECERRAAVGGLDAGGPGAEPPAPGSGDGKTRRGALDRAEDDFVLPEVFVGEREDSVRGRSALPGSLLRTDRDRVGTVVARGVAPKDHVHAWHPADRKSTRLNSSH